MSAYQPETPPPGAGGRPDLLPLALGLVESARERGLLLRLMGGLGFRAQVPTWGGRPRAAGADIDLVTVGKHVRAVGDLLAAHGYRPDRQHNALYGDRQLYFYEPGLGYGVDIVVDRLVMCHTLDLRDRLTIDERTLAPADLLLSKLQIVRFNRKDALDVLALMAATPVAASDSGAISVPRIVAHTSNDWGWWRTLTGNLDKLEGLIEGEIRGSEIGIADGDLAGVREKLASVRRAVEAAPKSIAWQLRNRIGDRLQWYDEPEEIQHLT